MMMVVVAVIVVIRDLSYNCISNLPSTSLDPLTSLATL